MPKDPMTRRRVTLRFFVSWCLCGKEQDTNGYFTITGRAPIRDENHQFMGTEVLWKRSTRPNDISEWDAEKSGGHQGYRFRHYVFLDRSSEDILSIGPG